jgi:hypothetical protein
MKMRLLVAGLVIATFCSAARAQQPQPRGAALPSREWLAAYADYLAARNQANNFRWVALPQIRQGLANEQKLVDQEIAVLERRVAAYGQFLLVGEYSPAYTAAENYALALAEARQRRDLLRRDRIALMRTAPQQSQLHQIELVRSAMTLRALSTPAESAAR